MKKSLKVIIIEEKKMIVLEMIFNFILIKILINKLINYII